MAKNTNLPIIETKKQTKQTRRKKNPKKRGQY